MLLLDSLLVLSQLLLYFLRRRLERFHQVVRLLVGNEIVLMFGRRLDVDLGRLLIAQVDNNLDGREAFEKAAQFFCFALEFGL